MTPNEYQKLAERTECDQTKPAIRVGTRTFVRVNHAVIGLAGEVGELASAVEKAVYYGQPFDTVNFVEELGDCLWYIAEACNALNVCLEDVMQANINKLRVRYPNAYSDLRATEGSRDRKTEQSVVHQATQSLSHLTQTGQGWAEPPEAESLAEVSNLDLVAPVGNLTEEDIALTQSFGDGLVQRKQLDNSYNRYCEVCHKNRVHYMSQNCVCPDCAQDIAAGRTVLE